MNETQVSGRRSRRSGQGRSRRNHGDSYSGSSERRSSGHHSSSAANQKPTLWQRITGFFTGGNKSAQKQSSSPTSSQESRSASQRPNVRKPELVEVNSPKLYVGNLSYDASESDLFELFNGVGKVQNAEIVSHKYTQKSKGFAFVMMATVDEAKRAVTELHDKEFMNRKLVVSGARTSDVRN